MEDSSQQGRDRIAPTSTSTSSGGGRSVDPVNLMEEPLPPKDERAVTVDPYPDAAVSGPLRDVSEQISDTSGALPAIYPYEGYDNNNVNWNGYSHYVNANGLQVVTPAVYNENPSLLFHSGYGFDPQMAYGQFSPIASPLSPIMVDGQLYPSHQVPVSPSYYPLPVPPNVPHVTSALQSSQTELVTPGSGSQDGFGDNMLLGPGSGYFVHFGSFGGGDATGNSYNPGFYRFPGGFGSGDLLPNGSYPSETGSYMSPLTSSAVYPQPIGILGSYEHNVGQIPQQQRPYHGVGSTSSFPGRRFPQGGSYQASNYGSTSISQWGGNQRNRVLPDKGGRKERDRDSICVSSDGIYTDHNRGPRASKQKGKSSTEEGSVSGNGEFNQPDFATNYENAKFFVIKSFSEDNVHKSIKYCVWASTPLGNRKLDAAYLEAKDINGGDCPVFLLFSVNASGQFCGVAEMIGRVDFEKDADYWQQDRWSGQFPVKWHIVKDVPNSHFRHILVENNDNKPVTHSRDCQEVKLEQGIEILKIFKEHDADKSILDDFNFYDERERALQERKTRQRASSAKNDSVPLADASINQLSENFAKNLQFEDGTEVSKTGIE